MKQILLIFLLFIAVGSKGQTVNDVLKKGRMIGKDQNLFLYFSEPDNKLHYSIRKLVGASYSYKLIDDSVLFLVKHLDGVLVYYAPVNPLNRTYVDTTFELIDEIDKASDEVLETLAATLTDLAKNSKIKAAKTQPKGKKGKKKTKSDSPPAVEAVCNFDDVKDAYNDTKKVLDDDKKSDIKSVFQRLSKIPFSDGASTDRALVDIGGDTTLLFKHFELLDNKISALESAIKVFQCDADYAFMTQFTLASMLDVVKTKRDEQKSRYTTLTNCYRLVADACTTAKGTNNKPEWSIGPVELSFSDKKMSLINITYERGGFEIDKNGDIARAERKNIASRTIRFRKYNLFVPEVLPGLAYLHIDFPKFSTTTDSAGKLHVASAGNEYIKRMNIATMVNFNFHTVRSSLNPFIQTGVGFNFQSPSLLMGGGLRIPIKSNGVLSISAGVAFTWVKTLKTLKVGDIVAGDADVDNDVTLEFNHDPKFYLGIQTKL